MRTPAENQQFVRDHWERVLAREQAALESLKKGMRP